MVIWLAGLVKGASPGNQTMQDISHLVQQGARAFLKREYMWVASLVAGMFVLIGLAGIWKPETGLGWSTGIAFLCGAAASMIAGYIGMSIATLANCRTAEAARVDGVNRALTVAVSGGAVMGLTVVGVAILGLVFVYWKFEGNPAIVNGYAMGASLVALFARCGGGIFTKGADMGADLVGKVEAGIPEDDPRNPAVIADNVGDNVGDVAGLGADLLESFVEAIIACMAIAAGFVLLSGERNVVLVLLPMAIAGGGILSSMIGVWFVMRGAGTDPQKALMNGTYVSGVLSIVATFILCLWADRLGAFENSEQLGFSWYGPAFATMVGVLAGMAVGFCSEYYTSSKYSPTRKLSENCQSGAAIAVTEGLAVGMQSTGVPVLVLALAVVAASYVAGSYGIAMAALGMLATAGMVVSVDSYGPIADNAGGIAEMAGLDPEVRKITDKLDSVGNTTAAIGKGFAIGSAAFAAAALVTAFMAASKVTGVTIDKAGVLGGLLVGGMLPFVFSSWLFRAVGNAAFQMIDEVRRQFREIPGLMEGTAKPDSATCVDISTQAAIKGMIKPGVMAIAVPVVVGFVGGAAALAGVLVGSLVTGVMLGIQTANSGGAMDNAKKYIEEGNFGGKGSDAHKAAVVGDTVGDPLKDTVGPSINILIKLMAVVALVIAPLLK
jgi:K(+)-stimulated pyrophosphate-energized sodium pump